MDQTPRAIGMEQMRRGSEKLVAEGNADVVDRAQFRERRCILDPELQIVLSPVEDRRPRPKDEPGAGPAKVGTWVCPESKTAAGFDVDPVRHPVLQRQGRNPRHLPEGAEIPIPDDIRSRNTPHQGEVFG